MYCKLENVQMVQCGLIYKFNPFHVCSVAENTTGINHTGKLIFFMRGGFIVGRITYCHCIQYVFLPRYIVEIFVKKINIFLPRYSVEIMVKNINICVLNTI